MSDGLTWPKVLTTLLAREDLSTAAAAWAMEEILAGSATPSQIAGFAVALRAKGETVEEIQGLVETMYVHAAPLDIPERAVDIVGTGGDLAHTVNISTMAAVVIAGTGALVVKHGNRAASSSSGSADVLEALGVRLDLPVGSVAAVARAAGITFCFAPLFHSSLRFVGPTRSQLGIPTTFNFLGPLANPARPAAMAVGVADLRMAPLMAEIFARRSVDALVFRGDDGLDELTTTTTSTVWSVGGASHTVEKHTLDPRELGFAAAPADALTGGDVAFNADVFRRVLDGEKSPVRDAVVLNAAAGVAAFDGGDDELLVRLDAAKTRVEAALDSGAARDVLDRWVSTTERMFSDGEQRTKS